MKFSPLDVSTDVFRNFKDFNEVVLRHEPTMLNVTYITPKEHFEGHQEAMDKLRKKVEDAGNS